MHTVKITMTTTDEQNSLRSEFNQAAAALVRANWLAHNSQCRNVRKVARKSLEVLSAEYREASEKYHYSAAV